MKLNTCLIQLNCVMVTFFHTSRWPVGQIHKKNALDEPGWSRNPVGKRLARLHYILQYVRCFHRRCKNLQLEINPMLSGCMIFNESALIIIIKNTVSSQLKSWFSTMTQTQAFALESEWSSLLLGSAANSLLS